MMGTQTDTGKSKSNGGTGQTKKSYSGSNVSYGKSGREYKKSSYKPKTYPKSSYSSGGSLRKSSTYVKKAASAYRKSGMSGGQIAACIAAFVIGIIAGLGSFGLITENDRFELVGDKEIKVALGEEFTYREEGARLVSLGRDLSEEVRIETNLEKTEDGYLVDSSKEGIYYIKYTSDDVKYKNTVRVRTIIVGGDAE